MPTPEEAVSNAAFMLNRQTGVTIGLAVVVLGAAVTAAWWFGQWAGQDRAWKTSTDKRLGSIERTLELGVSNRWTSGDMARWARRLGESNPELRVPEPYAD